MFHAGAAGASFQECVQGGGLEDQASRGIGVPQFVLHPGWVLLRKVDGKVGLLSSDQPLKRAQSNTLLNCVFFCGSTIGGASSIDGEESRNLRRQGGRRPHSER